LLVGEVFREYSEPWEGLARQYVDDIWNMTTRFVEQVLQYITDATVGDRLLRYLLDPIMDVKLKMAHGKLDELMAVHKEHPETRNHYFTETYNSLQQKKSQAKTKQALADAFIRQGTMNQDDIPYLVAKLHIKEASADMDLVAAESTLDAMEAFYQVRWVELIRFQVLTQLEM
jgi:hypothetical protein